MKNLLLFLVLNITLISCFKPQDENVLNKLIEESLISDENVERVFLNLKFGMSNTEFQHKLKEMNENGKIKRGYSNYTYEFNNNTKLKGIDWDINSGLHNDTITEINIYTYKISWKNNYHSINSIYKEIINEYTLSYGNPSYSKGEFENYWLKNNLLISITKSKADDLEGGIHVSYKDIRKEKSIDLTKCRFDEYGNSLDKWYYDLKEKQKGINKDI